MSDPCLPCKEIIDHGMLRNAATIYSSVLGDYRSVTTNVDALDVGAALFYAGVASDGGKSAAANKGLTNAEKEALAALYDDSCYHADAILEWAKSDVDTINEHVKDWTAQLFAWAKQAQDFYVALAKGEELPS